MRAGAVIAGLLLIAACSSHDGSDAGADGGYDASSDITTTFDASGDATQSCGPVDVTGFVPTPLVPPNPPHQSKCGVQQVADYAQCQGANVTSLCAQFADGQSGQTCRQCIETQSTAQRWGVIVFTNGIGRPNVEGCVDDALSQVPQEKANGGSGSCGDLLMSSYGCQDAACGACKDEKFDPCVQSAINGGCKSYDAPVESATGPCAALSSDAAPPALDACFPNKAISDATQQEVDWLTRIVGYMCGP